MAAGRGSSRMAACFRLYHAATRPEVLGRRIRAVTVRERLLKPAISCLSINSAVEPVCAVALCGISLAIGVLQANRAGANQRWLRSLVGLREPNSGTLLVTA